MDYKNKKVLVAYFSRKGQNYSNGKIIDLQLGNTEIVGKMIAKLTAADIFKIDVVDKYPVDYSECTAAAQLELQSNARPKLARDINTTDYEVIFLGYPNWWNTMPMPVWTFLEQHDFKSKTIIPFCTHEGSGLGNSESDLQKLCPNSTFKKGIAIHGSNANNAEAIIKNWLMKG